MLFQFKDFLCWKTLMYNFTSDFYEALTPETPSKNCLHYRSEIWTTLQKKMMKRTGLLMKLFWLLWVYC